MLIQGAYLGTGNKYKMDPFNSVIKAAVQMVTKPKFYASRQGFLPVMGKSRDRGVLSFEFFWPFAESL